MSTGATINLGSLLLSLSDAVDLANPRIAQHQQRTAYIALSMCDAAGLPPEMGRRIFIAALLHDIGAITVEEKVFLHQFDVEDLEAHCLRGELLLKRIPDFVPVAPIVRGHHTAWRVWAETGETESTLPSQIVLLSDFIERAIDRNTFILNQRVDIAAKARSVAGVVVRPDIVDLFLAASGTEGFWLDLVSPRLYSLLFHRSPLRNLEIDYLKLESISELFRDLIDFKSPFTAAHTSGVSACVDMLSRLAGFDAFTVQELRIAGNLHDLGKLAMPNSILEKPGPLSKSEIEFMKSHPYHSFNIINTIPGLDHIAEWAAYHHERLDGSGYPFHLTGERLSPGSRIVAVADIFTAIAEDRPYRRRMDKERIIATMSGLVEKRLIDQELVEVLVDNFSAVHGYVEKAQREARAFYDVRISERPPLAGVSA